MTLAESHNTYLFTYVVGRHMRHVHGIGRGFCHAEVLVIFIEDATSDSDGFILPFLRPFVGLEVPKLKAGMKY